MLEVAKFVGVWTALNFIIGVPVWMMCKTRDRQEKADLEALGFVEDETGVKLPEGYNVVPIKELKSVLGYSKAQI